MVRDSSSGLAQDPLGHGAGLVYTIRRMRTSDNLGKALGASHGEVKKAIEADEVKRGCKYYSEATAGKIKRLLEKS